jgi:hypothetical protein
MSGYILPKNCVESTAEIFGLFFLMVVQVPVPGTHYGENPVPCTSAEKI